MTTAEPQKMRLTDCHWRGVRVFIKDLTPEAYPEILHYLVRPFAEKFPTNPFFFSRYGPLPPGFDQDDRMPEDFWLAFTDGTRWHQSLRLRFVAPGEEEDFLIELLQARNDLYWHTPFEDYHPMSFAEDRAFAGGDEAAKIRRAGVVGEVLCSNSRYVLDTLQMTREGKWGFEENKKAGVLQMSFAFPLHMMVNTYGLKDGSATHAGILIGPNGKSFAEI